MAWRMALGWGGKGKKEADKAIGLSGGGGACVGSGESDGEACPPANDDGGDLIVKALSALDGASAAAPGSSLVGVGGGEERVDEFSRTRGNTAEGGEDEGNE